MTQLSPLYLTSAGTRSSGIILAGTRSEAGRKEPAGLHATSDGPEQRPFGNGDSAAETHGPQIARGSQTAQRRTN